MANVISAEELFSGENGKKPSWDRPTTNRISDVDDDDQTGRDGRGREEDEDDYGDQAEEVPARRANAEAGGPAEGVGGEAEKPKRRIVRNPQPKLDPDRICGRRGVGQLENIFAGFKARGKGKEFEDLDVVMKKMEHWAHRLYPKLPFDDVMERVATVGRKQAVKTYVKKLRMGMINPPAEVNQVEDGDDALGEGEDALRYEDGDEVQPEPALHADQDAGAFPPEEDFEQLMRESEEQERMELEEAGLAPPSQSANTGQSQQQSSTMSDEARARMEANRKRAEELRRKRAAEAAEKRLAASQDIGGQAEEEVRNVVTED